MDRSKAGERVVREYVHELEAAAEDIFPLLCPVREYDWIEEWACEMIFSDSGVAEDGCIFTTSFTGLSRATWVVTRYEPDASRIEFAVFHEAGVVERLLIRVCAYSTGARVHWTRSYTSVDAAGRDFMHNVLLTRIDAVMARLGRALDHYLRTGGMYHATATAES